MQGVLGFNLLNAAGRLYGAGCLQGAAHSASPALRNSIDQSGSVPLHPSGYMYAGCLEQLSIDPHLLAVRRPFITCRSFPGLMDAWAEHMEQLVAAVDACQVGSKIPKSCGMVDFGKA